MRGMVLWLSVAIVLGGIVHIAAMLVIPSLAPTSAFSRFEATMRSNLARVLEPANARQMPFPFASPDVIYVLCRYDVSTTPVRLTASTDNLYWSVGIYEPDGGNYFHINSMQSTSPNADILLLGRGQDADLGNDVTIVRATHPSGLIILRLFMRDRTMVKTLKTRAAQARCSAYVPNEPDDEPDATLPADDAVISPVATGSAG